MLNIAICDDDIQITGKIERLLQDIAKRNFVDTEIEVFWNGKSLADAIAAGERYDVIYLDIEMDKEDGISAARRIRTYVVWKIRKKMGHDIIETLINVGYRLKKM